MNALIVGAVAETAPRERRVALSPDGVVRLLATGQQVIIEAGAGAAAWFPDADYADAGARLVARRELYDQADVIVCVQPAGCGGREPAASGSGAGWVAATPHRPGTGPELAEAKVTAISLDGLPRTLSRAQSMDALSSQANVAGYKAALLAADTYGSYLPMFMTAAGTTPPGAGAGDRRRRRRAAGDRHGPPARRGGHRLRRPRRRPRRRGLHRRDLPRPRVGRCRRPARAAMPASSPRRSGTRSRPR